MKHHTVTQPTTFGVSAKNWLDSTAGQSLLAAIVAIVYLCGYFGHPALPGSDCTQPRGWWGWWDQGQYWKSAAALASGHLDASTYWYPIGYPLLGAIWWAASPQHAFCISDLLLTVAIALVFYRIARRLLGPTETLLFSAAFIFLYRGVLSVGLVVPFNTIPPHFFIYLCCLLIVFSPASIGAIAATSVLTGLTYLCRQGDIVSLLPLIAVAIVTLKSWRDRVKAAVISACILLIFAIGVGILNYSVFGEITTAYEKNETGLGFGSYPIVWKLYLLFLDGTPVFRQNEPMLLGHFPWLLGCMPGMIVLTKRFGLGALGILGSIAVTYGLYLEYNDFWPSNLFHFQLIHYLVWTLPLLGLVAYIGLRDGWKIPVGRWALLSIPVLGLIALYVNLVEDGITATEVDSAPTVQLGTASEKRPDWALFVGASKVPKLISNGKVLIKKQDFMDIIRPDGTAALFSPHVAMPVFVAVEDCGATRIDSGRLRWRWHFVRSRIPFLPPKTTVR